MNCEKNFLRTAGVIFTLVALAHLWMALTNTNISIGENELGIWVNWLAFIITGCMAIHSFKIRS